MTTRTYYLPRNRIAIHLVNYMVAKIGCSIGDIKINKETNTLKIPVTCNDTDVKRIESILWRYGMMEE